MIALELILTFAGFKTVLILGAIIGCSLISLYWELDEDIPPKEDNNQIDGGLPGRDDGDYDPKPPPP